MSTCSFRETKSIIGVWQAPARLNCAQSLIHAAQEVLGESEFKVEDFKTMGSGRAPGGTCGALHAACEAAPEAASVLKIQFAAKTGATTCHELKRSDGPLRSKAKPPVWPCPKSRPRR